MNWEQMKGSWTEIKGKVKAQWGNLTDDDIDRMAGERDQLIGRIQHRYGCTKEDAERQVDSWQRSIH